MQILLDHLKKFAAVLAATAAGCSPQGLSTIQLPNFAHPGPEAVQRGQYNRHDPYVLNDVGPEVVGGRPLAYQQSLTEEERALLKSPAVATMTPIPAPGAAVVAPPVLSSPIAVAPPQPGMALPAAAPPIVTSTTPVVAPSYSIPPVPPAVTSYPSVAQPAGFPAQQRAPY